MGEVILRNATAVEILGDVKTVHSLAFERGGRWFELADKTLGKVLQVADSLIEQHRVAEETLRPLLAELDMQDNRADQLIAQVSEEVLEMIGRPAFDPTFDVIFPNGIHYYTGGPDAEQPDRMELLAALLEMNLFHKMSQDYAADLARRVRNEMENYRKTLATITIPRRRLYVLERAMMALGQISHVALLHLKRQFRAEGFSEQETHLVIPDRARKQQEVQS